jgi:glycosyltransferase involved in cell wall biosynthesis
MPAIPFVSVIIPVYNGSKYIERCLDALMSSSYQSFEIIVVDDCSTDDTVKIAQQKGAKVFQLPKQSGTSVARNFGAERAQGNILLFVDSDVIVRRETIALVVDSFLKNPDIVAVFGSYDDDPIEVNFISQYRNLFHHFNHQYSDTEAFTFWAGCGAVRKKVFEEMGGFDQGRYTKPSIEDIELGYRIHKKGYRILLDKDLQVKHLKRWEFLPMLRTDIFQRAIPWSRLILETKFMPKDLNLQTSHKISAISVATMILMIPFLFLGHMKFYGIPVATTAGIFLLIFFITLLILNRKLYGFYAQKRGLRFMVQVIPLHLLYYLYSSMSFIFCWITHRISFLGSLLCVRRLRCEKL